jgi:ornithine carbamoyltransferase
LNLLSLDDWTPERIDALVDHALALAEDPAPARDALRGKTLLMLFEKPSLRTRVSFEVAMLQLGGHAIHYDLGMSPWRRGKETPEDTARTASRYVDAIMVRLYRSEDLAALARGATVPLVNGLTDLEHPCQALGDLATLKARFGRLRGLRLAYLGDARSNVTHSLMDGCARTGVDLHLAFPSEPGFAPAAEVLRRARRAASASGARLELHHDARAAVRGADAVYTDSWMSYHVPAEAAEARCRALEPYRVTLERMAEAAPHAVFLHCLPAQRGMEQDANVIDGPRSIVFDQAEMRLHTEKALLLHLLGDGAARVG